MAKIKIEKISEEEERAAWMAIAESHLKRIWDNPKEDEVWNKYLKMKKKTLS